MSFWGGTGTTGDTGSGGTDWAKYAELLMKAYATYQNTRPNQIKQVPEDPSLIALRKQLMGYMTDSPTRNMLGGMLKPMIEKSANSQFNLPQGANGYNPYPNGNAPVKYDLSKILPNISTSDNPTAKGQSQIPPPPPEVKTLSGKKRINHRAKGALRGLLGGLGGGGWGAAAGAVTGTFGSRAEDEAAWDAAWKPYNDWKAQWGSYFGDHIPQNQKEYEAWYLKTYGRPYGG